ncbi:MAG: endospore germination permease [Clostridiales bacterium]|nr:endospore germination permease [Clostridiales bacterium]
MHKERLTPFQILAITVVFLGAGSYLMTSSALPPHQDGWLGSVVGGLLAIPMFFIYFRLLHVYPGKDIFQILTIVCGRIVGKLLIFLYLLFAFLFAATALGYFIQFVNTVSLAHTPKYLLAALSVITCMALCQKGLSAFGRYSEFVFGAVVIFALAAVTLSLPQAELYHVKPLFSGDWQRLWQQGYAFFSNPFAGAFLLTGVLDALHPKEKLQSSLGWGLIIAWALLIATEFRNYSVLGNEVMAGLFYPSYSAAGLIKVGEFFQRIEVLSALGILFSQITRAAVAVFFICRGLANLCRLDDYHKLAVPVGFWVFNLSLLLFTSSVEAFSWFDNFRYSLVLPPLVILPLLIWLIGEIRFRRKKLEGKS